MFRRNIIPNILTFSRIIIIPIIVASFFFENNIFARKLAAVLFIIASITDFFDGYLARIWQSQSNLGRFLDPIADKLLVGAIILMLVHAGRADIVPSLLIICREILVSGLREFLAELRVSIPVTGLAKIKTTIQMLAIFLLLLGNEATHLPFIDLIARITLWIAAILTIITGYAYLKAGIKYIAQEDDQA